MEVLTTRLVREAPAAADTTQQLALLREELRELWRPPVQQTPQASVLQSVLLAALVLGLGTLMGLMVARSASPARRRLSFPRGARSSTAGKEAEESPLPFYDLYRLEALVTQLRAAWPDIAQSAAGGTAPTDVNEFLRVMTRVRGQLEGAPPRNESDEGKPLKFKFSRNISVPALHQLDDALSNLERLLLTRQDSPLSAWRPSMGKALAQLQRALIGVCEPYKYGLPAPAP